MESVLKQLTLDFFGTGCHKITAAKLLNMDNAVFVDVRSQGERETLGIHLQHHKGIKFLHIPLDELPERYHEIPSSDLVAFFCPANVRSTIAMVFLLYKGYKNVRIVEGGYAALTNEMMPGKVLSLINNNQ